MNNDYADPSGIGQLGLALITLIAGFTKIGFLEGTGLLLVWALVAGSLMQLYAGAVDMKKNKALGGALFIGYGIFWLGIALSYYLQAKYGNDATTQFVFDSKSYGVIFLGYLIFTAFMLIPAKSTYATLFGLMLLITALFTFLTLGSFTGNHTFSTIAGYIELAISFLAFYSSAALITNAHYDDDILPIGKFN